jgi:hypothetical protein
MPNSANRPISLGWCFTCYLVFFLMRIRIWSDIISSLWGNVTLSIVFLHIFLWEISWHYVCEKNMCIHCWILQDAVLLDILSEIKIALTLSYDILFIATESWLWISICFQVSPEIITIGRRTYILLKCLLVQIIFWNRNMWRSCNNNTGSISSKPIWVMAVHVHHAFSRTQSDYVLAPFSDNGT